MPAGVRAILVSRLSLPYSVLRRPWNLRLVRRLVSQILFVLAGRSLRPYAA
jgi:hypothetical protein